MFRKFVVDDFGKVDGACRAADGDVEVRACRFAAAAKTATSKQTVSLQSCIFSFPDRFDVLENSKVENPKANIEIRFNSAQEFLRRGEFRSNHMTCARALS